MAIEQARCGCTHAHTHLSMCLRPYLTYPLVPMCCLPCPTLRAYVPNLPTMAINLPYVPTYLPSYLHTYLRTHVHLPYPTHPTLPYPTLPYPILSYLPTNPPTLTPAYSPTCLPILMPISLAN